MPYLNERRREDFEPALTNMTLNVTHPGDLNYIINVLGRELARTLGDNYNAHNDVIGAMECAKQEYYRRVVAPYEDIKIEQNGDVF